MNNSLESVSYKQKQIVKRKMTKIEKGEKNMTVINATNARVKLYQLIADVNANAEPITIINNKGQNAVLISEDDWKAIEETIYLNAIPGIAKSIIDADKEALSACEKYSEDEEW